MVLCAKCKVPHHKSCWTTGCAIFGCGGVAPLAVKQLKEPLYTVKLQKPSAVSARPSQSSHSKKWIIAGVSIVALGYVGIMALIAGFVMQKQPQKNTDPVKVAPQKILVEKAPPVASLPQFAEFSKAMPGLISDAVPAAGGEYLVLHFKALRKLGIFDIADEEFTGYIDLPSENILYAAGRSMIFVVLTDSNVARRYNITTLQQEGSAQLPVTGVIKTIAMGSDSEGPVLLHTSVGTDSLDRAGFVFIDPYTISTLDINIAQNHYTSFRDFVHVRASGDGSVFGMWATSHSPSGMQTFLVSGSSVSTYYEHDSSGHVVPGFQGNSVYSGAGVFSSELKAKYTDLPRISYFPGINSNFFVGLSSADEKKQRQLYIYSEGNSRPLFKLPSVPGLGRDEGWTKEDFTIDKRVYFLPATNKDSDHSRYQ